MRRRHYDREAEMIGKRPQTLEERERRSRKAVRRAVWYLVLLIILLILILRPQLIFRYLP